MGADLGNIKIQNIYDLMIQNIYDDESYLLV